MPSTSNTFKAYKSATGANLNSSMLGIGTSNVVVNTYSLAVASNVTSNSIPHLAMNAVLSSNEPKIAPKSSLEQGESNLARPTPVFTN